MNIGSGWRSAAWTVRSTVETACDRISEWLRRDPVLANIKASETPEQRRLNDTKQRGAEALWKMQYKGRPGRDPEFRRAERLIYQKGLSPTEEARELIPLWKRHHAKYAKEGSSPETSDRLRKAASRPLLRTSRTLDTGGPLSSKTEPGSRLTQPSHLEIRGDSRATHRERLERWRNGPDIEF